MTCSVRFLCGEILFEVACGFLKTGYFSLSLFLLLQWVHDPQEEVRHELVQHGQRPPPPGPPAGGGCQGGRPGHLAAVVGLVVHRLEELPGLGLGPVQLVAPAPGALGVGRGLGGGDQPRGQVVPRRVHVLHAPLDRVVVLVAGHAHDVEEDLPQRVRDAGLDGAEAAGELPVAAAP